MKPTRWELRRREFLKAMGLGGAMLPLLAESRAHAAGPTPRLFVITKGQGCAADTFWPTTTDGSLMTATFPKVTSPLEPFRSKLLFVDGMALRNWWDPENTTGGNGDSHHAFGSTLTGELPSDRLLTTAGCRINKDPPGCRMLGGGPSVDCYVGKRLRDGDPTLAHASLHLGIHNEPLQYSNQVNGVNKCSWHARDQVNAPEYRPDAAFMKLFGGALPGAPSDPVADRARLRQRGLLDFVNRDLQRFAARLGREDRALVDAHLAAVRRREQQLATVSRLMCAPGPAPAVRFLDRREEHIPEYTKVMLDMLLDALKCGLTRVAMFSMFDNFAESVFGTWLKAVNPNFTNQKLPGGMKLGGYDSWQFHGMAHGHGSEPAKGMYRDLNWWFVSQLAYVLDRLSKEPEGTGTMLDNTVVLYAEPMSNGAGHSVRRLSWILAGNARGYFNTGRLVKVANDTPTNGLLFAITEAMGVAPDDGVFGNAKFGKGPMLALKS